MKRTEQRFAERSAKIAALLNETESGLRDFSRGISVYSNLISGLNLTGNALKMGTGELEIF